MTKKSNDYKKLGARVRLKSPKELLTRYEALRAFFERNWGQIGLPLQRVHDPDNVRAVLKAVPGVEWCSPFREEAHLGCILTPGNTKVTWRELRRTKESVDYVIAFEDQIRTEFYSCRPKAEEAVRAFKVFLSQFGLALTLFPFFLIAVLVAKALAVEELTTAANQYEASLRIAENVRRAFQGVLLCEKGWFARNEIVRFVRSRRYTGTPATFAKAMAGLPEYSWLRSYRKTELIGSKSTASVAYYYQLFTILKEIVQKSKPLKLAKIEMKLREKLLHEDTDPLLRATIAPDWAYMKQAFAACRGKRFKRSELPFKIMGQFLENTQTPKSVPETELAKREQLV